MVQLNRLFVLLGVLLCSVVSYAQTPEPDFVGEVYWQKSQGDYAQLGKEFGSFTSGISWKSNSFNAKSLEIEGGKAQTRISMGQPITLIVRAVDNNSDPLSIVYVYKLNAKKKKRTTVLGEDNTGTLLKSRTHTKNLVTFSGKKYGNSSYLISLGSLPVGEYGIVVVNPNGVDEKRIIVSTFGVDK